MKTKKELNVDFIGGAKPLTKEEEQRISEIIKKLKLKRGQTDKAAKKIAMTKKEKG